MTNSSQLLISLKPKLQKLIDTLLKLSFHPILVGGFVRDTLMNQTHSKDIDIEVYGVDNVQKLKTALKEYSINEVGKSFGVLKLIIDDMHIDISLPRIENKTAHGHQGFEVTTHANLSFKEAFRRRDFTINAIGYDLKHHRFVDEYEGITHIKQKRLVHVDEKTFIEDPLRVYRAVQFASRFEFAIDPTTYALCQRMIADGQMAHLSQERIDMEIQKLFLRSKNPAVGVKLLFDLQLVPASMQAYTVDEKTFILQSITRYAPLSSKDSTKNKLALYFALLGYWCVNSTKSLEFFSLDKEILQTSLLLRSIKGLPHKRIDDVNVGLLSLQVNIAYAVRFFIALGFEDFAQKLKAHAKTMGVLNKPIEAIVTGKTLLSMNLTPSKVFGVIIKNAYKAQLEKKFTDEASAKAWLKAHYKSLFK